MPALCREGRHQVGQKPYVVSEVIDSGAAAGDSCGESTEQMGGSHGGREPLALSSEVVAG
jgi:hypothetical protein